MQDKELQEALEDLTGELAGLVEAMVLAQSLDQVVAEFQASVITLADDATELGLQYYEELLPDSSFVPRPFHDPSLKPRLAKTAEYAVGAKDPKYILEGSGTRAIMDQGRSTLIHNVEREGGKWYRIAAADSCGFCRLLATRGPVYRSSHAAAASHDRCKCKVAVQRPSMTHTPPAHMNGWDKDYRRLRREVVSSGQEPTFDNIVNAWNRQIRQELKAAGALEDVA